MFAPNLPLFLQQIENKPQSWDPTTAEQALINLDFMRFCEDISGSKIHERVMRVNVLVVKTGKVKQKKISFYQTVIANQLQPVIVVVVFNTCNWMLQLL